MFRGREHPSIAGFKKHLLEIGYITPTKEEIIANRVTPMELRQHSTYKDAWVSMKGFVYNVTPYINYHPGGLGCFSTYFGYDAYQAAKGVHGFVDLEKILEPVLIGVLDGEPMVPDNSRLRVERGQL